MTQGRQAGSRYYDFDEVPEPWEAAWTLGGSTSWTTFALRSVPSDATRPVALMASPALMDDFDIDDDPDLPAVVLGGPASR